jgi:protein tyrosine/serine phosphatase
VGTVDRSLAWDGCFNVRDLGGLETASGGRTRRGAVVRADNVRRLSVEGWQTAFDHGVRRLVDLRFEAERESEPDPPAGVDVVAVSLFGRHDPVAENRIAERLMSTDDAAAAHAGFYIRTLEQRPETVAAAVAAVAGADRAGGVVIHCFAGKDRTGIVSALVLGVAGVPDEIVAADYAESGPNMSHLFDGWIADATTDEDRELRRRLAQAEHATMQAMLEWLRESAGGAAGYLREAGISEEQLERLRARLVEA